MEGRLSNAQVARSAVVPFDEDLKLVYVVDASPPSDPGPYDNDFVTHVRHDVALIVHRLISPFVRPDPQAFATRYCRRNNKPNAPARVLCHLRRTISRALR